MTPEIIARDPRVENRWFNTPVEYAVCYSFSSQNSIIDWLLKRNSAIFVGYVHTVYPISVSLPLKFFILFFVNFFVNIHGTFSNFFGFTWVRRIIDCTRDSKYLHPKHIYLIFGTTFSWVSNLVCLIFKISVTNKFTIHTTISIRQPLNCPCTYTLYIL